MPRNQRLTKILEIAKRTMHRNKNGQTFITTPHKRIQKILVMSRSTF